VLSKGSESECDNNRTAQIMGRSEAGVVCEVIIDATALEKKESHDFMS
jgi:hypothetical protein